MLKLLDQLETQFGMVYFIRGYKRLIGWTKMEIVVTNSRNKKHTSIYCPNCPDSIFIESGLNTSSKEVYYARAEYDCTNEQEKYDKLNSYHSLPLYLRYEEGFKEIWDKLPKEFDDPYEELIIVSLAGITKADMLLNSINSNKIISKKEIIITCDALYHLGYYRKIRRDIKNIYELKFKNKIDKWKQDNS